MTIVTFFTAVSIIFQIVNMGRLMKEFEDDFVLIKKIIAGDVDLFAQIVDRYKSHVASIVTGRVPFDDVEEVCHNIFLRTFKSLSNYTVKTHFSHWLSRIAVRGCCDFWRAKKRRHEIPVSTLNDEQQDFIDVVGSESSKERFEHSRELDDSRELLKECMKALSPEDRMLIELVYWEGWKLKDVAESFGWGVPKTKVRSMRAKQKLRKLIEKMIEDEG